MDKVREAIIRKNKYTIEILGYIIENLKRGDTLANEFSIYGDNVDSISEDGDWIVRFSTGKKTFTLETLTYEGSDKDDEV